MFGELAEDVAVDLRAGLRGIERELDAIGGAGGSRLAGGDRCETEHDDTDTGQRRSGDAPTANG